MTGERKYVRQVVAYANYFKDFKKTLSKETLQKMYQYHDARTSSREILKGYNWSCRVIRNTGRRRRKHYRIFCCMNEGRLVILFNGFQKKTQKTPPGEIERAKRIMNEYFDQKKKGETI